jgi:hypothetical protein
MEFDGKTYNATLDKKRLANQLVGVRNAMLSGNWLTLERLAEIVCCSTQSCSARLRDLRKAKHGSHTIERRRHASAPSKSGLFEYRLKPESAPIYSTDGAQITFGFRDIPQEYL